MSCINPGHERFKTDLQSLQEPLHTCSASGEKHADLLCFFQGVASESGPNLEPVIKSFKTHNDYMDLKLQRVVCGGIWW